MRVYDADEGVPLYQKLGFVSAEQYMEKIL